MILVDLDGIPMIVTDVEMYPRDPQKQFTLLQERKKQANMENIIDGLDKLFKWWK